MKFFTRIIITLLFSSFCFLNAQIKFKHLTLKDGLSQSSINTIIKDKFGFIWFGTQDGLNKYDGYTFTVFKNRTGDSTSISDNYITAAIADKNGDLWIGTANGLNKLKIEEEIFQRYKSPVDSLQLSDKYISSLLVDENFLWVGTWGTGLYKINLISGEVTLYKNIPGNPNSICGNDIRTIFPDSKKRMWLATWNGLSLYNKEKNNFENFLHNPDDPNSISHNQVTGICEDAFGNIWTGTYENGLNKLDIQKKKFTRYYHTQNKNSVGGNQIVTLLCSKKGIWIGTFDGGLSFYDYSSKRFTNYISDKNDPSSLTDNSIVSIYLDNERTLWVGTFSGGINVYDHQRNQFKHYKSLSGMEKTFGDGVVRSIFEDSDGILWIGLRNGGVSKFFKDSEQFQYLKDEIKVNIKSVYSIIEDSKKNIWIGTEGDGLIKYNKRKGTITYYKHNPTDPKSLSNNFVMKIFEDRSGNIWVGTTGGGLNKYDEKTDSFIRFRDELDLDRTIGRNVWEIYQDSSGDIWLGTWGAGLTKLDLKNFKHKRYLNQKDEPSSLSNNTVFCLTEDDQKNLLIGTWGGGLNIYKKETDNFSRITDADGLSNNVIYGILKDKTGNLWVSTNYGLSRINLSTKEIKNYSEADGLQSNEFNQGAYCLSKSGEMFFGGINGFNRFYPDSIKENTNIPPVLITQFKIFDKPVSFTKAVFALKEITLEYSENYFSVEFASLDYTNPSENRYEYKLEGFDKNWINSGKRRFASYTNLDPGEYLFRVKGSNNDCYWNEEGAVLKIIINPPFWLTWWFRLIALIVIASIVYSLYSYRVKRLLEIERIKNRLASDLHDDIATNLSSIAMFSQIIQDESKKSNVISPMMNQLMEKITAMSQDSVSSIRDIIWAIDPKQETIYDLLLRARDSFIMHCRAKNIDFNLDLPEKEQLPKQNLAPEERKNIWLLIKEAVTNSIKHSCATEIALHAVYKNHTINIIIIDNGKGFDTSAGYSGKGMNTMKKRAENLGGEVTVVSNPGQGTIINLQLKI